METKEGRNNTTAQKNGRASLAKRRPGTDGLTDDEIWIDGTSPKWKQEREEGSIWKSMSSREGVEKESERCSLSLGKVRTGK
jgi:hypothetical protein